MRVAPSIELKIEALYDCWAFFELIKYQGGVDQFDQCHFQFLLTLQAPQLYQAKKFTPELRKIWEEITEQKLPPSGEPPPNILAQFPRGHLKTTLVTGWLLWRIYRNPNICILVASSVSDLSEAYIRQLRQYLEDDELGETVWSARPHIRGHLVPPLNAEMRRARKDENEALDKKVVWTGEMIQVLRGVTRKEATVAATSVGASSVGFHYDVVVMDDIVDKDNSKTESTLQKVARWAADIASIRTKITYPSSAGVLPSGKEFTERLGDQYIVVGTHYDPKDYYSFIKTRAQSLRFAVFSRSIYKNGVDNTSGYLWNQFTEQMELELRAELSEFPGLFDAQYLNLVMNKGLQVLHTSNITFVDSRELEANASREYTSFKHPDTHEIDWLVPILAVDPASTATSRSDFSSVAVGGLTFNEHLAALDFSTGHYSVEKLTQEIVRLAIKWKVRRIYVETIGFQALLKAPVMRALREANVTEVGVLDYKPHGNKHKRIEVALSQHFENRTIIFGSNVRNDQSTMNCFHFFGRQSSRDDPPDALSVVKLNTHKPAPRSDIIRRSRTSYLPPQHTGVNVKYGGMY